MIPTTFRGGTCNSGGFRRASADPGGTDTAKATGPDPTTGIGEIPGNPPSPVFGPCMMYGGGSGCDLVMLS